MGTEITPRDEALLRLASEGKTGLEMQKATGLDSTRCILRVKELLRKADVWTEVERRQLVTRDLYDLRNQLREQTKDYINDKMATVLLQTISAIDVVLDKQGKITDEQLAKVSAAQAQAMMGMIRAGFDHARRLLEAEYPDVPAQAIEAAFRTGLSEQMLNFNDEDEVE